MTPYRSPIARRCLCVALAGIVGMAVMSFGLTASGQESEKAAPDVNETQPEETLPTEQPEDGVAAATRDRKSPGEKQPSRSEHIVYIPYAKLSEVFEKQTGQRLMSAAE